jgi:hypothetical protein
LQLLLHLIGIRISLLQIRQFALRLVELPRGNQMLRLAQSLIKALLALAHLAFLLNFGKQFCGLAVGGVKLQRSPVLAFRGAHISLPHGALARADRLTNLPQEVALLDRAHLQLPHSLIVRSQFLRFGKNPDSLTKFALVKGLLASHN